MGSEDKSGGAGDGAKMPAIERGDEAAAAAAAVVQRPLPQENGSDRRKREAYKIRCAWYRASDERRFKQTKQNENGDAACRTEDESVPTSSHTSSSFAGMEISNEWPTLRESNPLRVPGTMTRLRNNADQHVFNEEGPVIDQPATTTGSVLDVSSVPDAENHSSQSDRGSGHLNLGDAASSWQPALNPQNKNIREASSTSVGGLDTRDEAIDGHDYTSPSSERSSLPSSPNELNDSSGWNYGAGSGTSSSAPSQQRLTYRQALLSSQQDASPGNQQQRNENPQAQTPQEFQEQSPDP